MTWGFVCLGVLWGLIAVPYFCYTEPKHGNWVLFLAFLIVISPVALWRCTVDYSLFEKVETVWRGFGIGVCIVICVVCMFEKGMHNGHPIEDFIHGWMIASILTCVSLFLLPYVADFLGVLEGTYREMARRH